MNNIGKPILIENGTQYFLRELLKNCHSIRMNYYNQIYNIGLFIFFFFILATFLIFSYKGKLTQEQIDEKERERQLYILSKVKNYQDARQKISNNNITGLHEWENEQEYIFRKVVNI